MLLSRVSSNRRLLERERERETSIVVPLALETTIRRSQAFVESRVTRVTPQRSLLLSRAQRERRGGVGVYCGTVCLRRSMRLRGAHKRDR
jgi:hypothetical protein